MRYGLICAAAAGALALGAGTASAQHGHHHHHHPGHGGYAAPGFGGYYAPAPAVDADGLLTLVGTLDGDATIHFDLKYIQEKGAWKLFGIKLRLE